MVLEIMVHFYRMFSMVAIFLFPLKDIFIIFFRNSRKLLEADSGKEEGCSGWVIFPPTFIKTRRVYKINC